jgi:hypothetical protein
VKLRSALALSVALHLAVLGNSSPPSESSSRKEESVVKINATLAEAFGSPSSKQDGTMQSAMTDACPGASYVGIGIMTDLFGVVSYLAPSGPAIKAGVQLGDILQDRFRDKYPIGAVVKIPVSRGDENRVFSATVSKICIEN